MRPKAKTLAGVDIGTSSVKIAALRRTRKDAFELEALAVEALPPDSIVDGVIISKLAVAEAIERIFKSQRIRNERIATSICGHSVIVKKVDVPSQSEHELNQSIQWEAEQYIPFDISEVNLDYQILGKTGDGSRMEVLLVVAKRDKITDYTSVLSMAGKRPVVVDIDAFALQNVFEVNYRPEKRKVVALLDIGATTMSVSIVMGREFLFTRDIAMGGNHYTELLQKELNISFEEAERYKAGQAPSEELKGKTDTVVDSVSEILTLEVQKTFDFFQTTAHSGGIHEIYLSGGASRTHGLREYLQDKLQSPVEHLNPLKDIRVDKDKFPDSLTTDLAMDFAIAVGLALRTERD
ncbi:MAG: type IV pilus assembly protein PilM [Acidobacteriota bacterium]